MIDKTTDSNYTYKRKTSIDNNTLKFSYEYDLTKEIVDADVADMILYTCQSDIDLQKILERYDEVTLDILVEIVNEYRLSLLK
ncbi:hypothetical protein [Haploplasma axanthum]|uniref:Uncharacterized protein n=1 Tax=Haploplasma axanthum TaxID=29552 RepID=A0A449BEJ3_HAPAX|nr:hypothetical protein [Haploplasma axanthum]VEU80848.1 Uncharacterised protein [Haploplasma axanthum]